MNYRQALGAIRPALPGVAGLGAGVNLPMPTGPVYMRQVHDRVLASGSVATLQGPFRAAVPLYAFLGSYDSLRHGPLSRAGYRLDELLAAPAFAGWCALRLRSAAKPRRGAMRRFSHCSIC